MALLAVAIAAPASAADVKVDLTPTVNGNWAGQSFNDVPTGDVSLGGVSFSIAALNGSAAHRAFTGSGTQQITYSTNVFGVTNVYSLINTFWGSGSTGLHSVRFGSAGGLSQSFAIDGNDDVRDYLNGVYTNSINGTTTTNVFNSTTSGPRRLDMQNYALAAGFANDTLTSITFIDNG